MTPLEYERARRIAAEKFISYLESQPERDDMYKPQYQRILNKWQSLVNTPEPELECEHPWGECRCFGDGTAICDKCGKTLGL